MKRGHVGSKGAWTATTETSTIAKHCFIYPKGIRDAYCNATEEPYKSDISWDENM